MEHASGARIKTIRGVGGASPLSKAKENPFWKTWNCRGSLLKSAGLVNGQVKVGTISMHGLDRYWTLIGHVGAASGINSIGWHHVLVYGQVLLQI